MQVTAQQVVWWQDDHQDVIPTPTQEQAAQWKNCLVSQSTYSRVQNRQQKCLSCLGTNLQEHWSVLICQTACVQEEGERSILCHSLQLVRLEPCEYNSILSWVSFADLDVWWWKEGMKLGKLCCPSCQVLYYPQKSYGIWVLRPWSMVKSLIFIEWNQVWQVVLQ